MAGDDLADNGGRLPGHPLPPRPFTRRRDTAASITMVWPFGPKEITEDCPPRETTQTKPPTTCGGTRP